MEQVLMVIGLKFHRTLWKQFFFHNFYSGVDFDHLYFVEFCLSALQLPIILSFLFTLSYTFMAKAPKFTAKTAKFNYNLFVLFWGVFHPSGKTKILFLWLFWGARPFRSTFWKGTVCLDKSQILVQVNHLLRFYDDM